LLQGPHRRHGAECLWHAPCRRLHPPRRSVNASHRATHSPGPALTADSHPTHHPAQFGCSWPRLAPLDHTHQTQPRSGGLCADVLA
jgi:hypothetical protein